MYSDYKSKNNRNLDIDMTFANVREKNDKMLKCAKVNGNLIQFQHDP